MNHDLKATPTRTNVIGFLKGQHKQIKGLFERVLATHGADRTKAFSELKSLMLAHEAAEEEVVHPWAKSVLPGGVAEVAARLDEENTAKRALAILAALDVRSVEFETTFRALQADVLAHAESEETEELEKLAIVLDGRTLIEMRNGVERVESDTLKQAT